MISKIVVTGLALTFASACGHIQTPTPQASQNDTQAQEAVTGAPQTACQDEEYRQLDFWVGEWDLEWDAGGGKTGHGTNIITNSPFGDCVITEKFDGAPTQKFKGMSVSTYHKQAGAWRQTWVDDQGGYFALSGGPNADGAFELLMTRLNDKGPHRRMVWKDITTDSLTWHWQGHKDDETEWQDQWVIRYKRKPEP